MQKLEDQRLLTGDGGTVRLAHERLITAWPALAQVVTEHKEDMVLQARLERQAADWRAGAGELLGRDAMETATRWLAGHADHATAQGVVGQYVRRSKAALSRRRQARASALAVIIALAVAAASVAAYAVNKNSELSADARTAISDEIATEAVDVMPTDAVVGTLLSLESLRLADGAPARSAALEAMHQPIDAILGKGNEDAHPVVLSPGGRYWATGATSGQVTLWDMGTGNELGRPLEFFRPPGPGVYSTRAVTSMAFSPDGETLAIGDDDGEIVLWDVATSKELGHPLEPFRAEGLAKVGQGGVFSLAFSPKGDTLASGDGNGDVVRWDVATGQEIGRPLNRSDSVVPVAVGALAFSPDGKILASGNDVGDVVRWDLATGQEIGHSWVLASEAIIDALAFSPDGETIATGDSVGGVQLWDVATGTARGQTGNLTGGDFINSVAFSPGGKTLATGDETGDVKLWDVATGTEIGHAWSNQDAGAVQTVAFSSDGATGESGEANGDVVRWDVGAAHEVGSILTGPSSSAVDAVDFGPNGQILASGDDNGDLVLWDVATERQRGKR